MQNQKAIVKQDVFSHIRAKHQYAKKNDVVTVAEVRDHVAIAIKQNGDWFPVNIEKLTLIN